MSVEQERTVIIAQTKSAFEAETIVGALRERGVGARVVGTAITGVGGPQVGVLEPEADSARRALAEILADSQGIDWDAVDLGSDPEVQRLAQVSKSRRWVWTVVMLLVPAGFGVLTVGVNRGDPMIKILGGVLLAAALVMGAGQMMPDRR